MKKVQEKEVLLFLSIVYIVTYSIFIFSISKGISYKNFVPYTMVIPGIAAIAVALIYKNNFNFILKNLKFNKWIFISTFYVLFIYILCSLIKILYYSFYLNKPYLIKIPSPLTMLTQIIIGIFIGGICAAFEEIGWRGFLQSKLNSTFHSYFFIGICWSAFHFPQILSGLIYKNHLVEGLIIHTFILTFFSIFLCYIREKSSSLISTSIAHGLFNIFIFTEATNVIKENNQVIEGNIFAILFLLTAIIIFFKKKKEIL